MEAVIGAIIAGIVALIGGYISNSVADSHNKKTEELAQDNLDLNEKVATQNFELSQDQFEYQKQLNDLTMKREDTAFQRQVEDLKAAGLSPLNIAGGASATPLTSANAPQFDLTGINQAAQGLIGAYNDAFNRKLTSRQFALQAKSQTAQIYTQLAENYRDQKQAQLEYQYLDEKLKWEKKHGFRDVNWKSDLTQLIESWLDKNGSSVLPTLSGSENNGKTLKDKILDSLGINSSEDIETALTEPDPYQAPDPVTSMDLKNQTEYNTKKLHQKQKKEYDYAQSQIKIKNLDLYGKDKDLTKCIDFIYRHTKAHEDYDTVYLFRNALKKDRSIAKKYDMLYD